MSGAPEHLPEELGTERLLLRPYRPGDGAWLHAAFERDRAHLADALVGLREGLGLDVTRQGDAEIYVRQLVLDWASRRRFVFGAWEREGGAFVGEIWIETRDWRLPLGELGYFLVAERLGRGLATEAARAGLRFLFHDLGVAKARLICDADNVRSYRVAERLGFVLEGRLRSEVPRGDGAAVDTLYYGLLRSEFEALE